MKTNATSLENLGHPTPISRVEKLTLILLRDGPVFTVATEIEGMSSEEIHWQFTAPSLQTMARISVDFESQMIPYLHELNKRAVVTRSACAIKPGTSPYFVVWRLVGPWLFRASLITEFEAAANDETYRPVDRLRSRA